MTDRQLFTQFENLTLPFDQWTHRAHVRVAYLYLSRHPFNTAMNKIRAGIKAYNAANHRPDGPTTGYNETTTRAFLHLIAAVTGAYGKDFPTKTADKFCDAHPQLMSKHVLRFFYSPKQRMHKLAKTTFVKPDLTGLPKITRSRR